MILRRGIDDLVGRPKSNCLSSRRTSVPFTQFLIKYMAQARSLDKLSSEWGKLIEIIGRQLNIAEKMIWACNSNYSSRSTELFKSQLMFSIPTWLPHGR